MQNTLPGPQWTEYSLNKARERFPGMDLDSLYMFARLVQKGKIKKAIKKKCRPADRKWMDFGYVGRYYKVTPNRIVFVLATPETIITVFRV